MFENEAIHTPKLSNMYGPGCVTWYGARKMYPGLTRLSLRRVMLTAIEDMSGR